MSKHYLDARRLLCPLPVIRVQQIIQTLQPKDILVVTCTDSGVLHDIPAWCRIHQHEVLEIQQEQHEIKIMIRVN